MPDPNVARPVFISYAHEDNESSDRSKRWLDRLKQFLEPLVAQEELMICSDQDIDLGDDWHDYIQRQLDGARAAVLLVSPAFLASGYVRSSELPVLLRNARERGVKIIPVIVRRCLFEETKFKYPDPKTGPEEFTLASLQAPNSPTKPLSGMTEDEQDEVLLKLARGLIKLATAKPETGSSDRGQRASESTPSPKTTASRKTRQRRATSVAKQPAQTAADSYNRGLRYLAAENYAEALAALDQAIELDPTLALAHYNRGLTYYFMRNEDLAIENFDRALELGFGDAILFRQRANAFSRKGDVARAVADYAQAIALEPQDPLAYLNRGEVYENTLQKKLAVADYKTVLNLECDPQLKETARTRLRAMGVKLVASDATLALSIWQKKLAFLQAEEARAADADQKFSIQQRIEEAKAKVQELGG